MRNRIVSGLLIGWVTLLPPNSWAISKTTEKALFAAGLLTLGGVVYIGIVHADRQNVHAIRKLHNEWGKPFSTILFPRGFDQIRIEEYHQGKRRALVRFRNGKLENVEILSR